MLQITTTLNNPTIVHLDSSTLISGLNTASFTLTAVVGGAAATASNISLALTEVSATHYTASMSFSKLGNHYVKLVYSTFAESMKRASVNESARKKSVASKPVASTKSKKPIIGENTDFKSRMQKLANII